ncbi:hypothetical protein CEP54_013604 [Fusarium duplospermum]|uniref:Uncharacterized protein n=1 Tax=Fusarium duplospermum TaxID=1325734 RepID=A0A428P1U3_9HYPO|nr:hypothetical protein CEP54_013604 [Fusarium duplospermum]
MAKKTNLVDEMFSDDSSDYSDSSESSDDYNNDLNDEKLIGASLRNPQTSQQFASHHDLEFAYKVPRMHVPDVGLVDMPLKESQARQLIAKAHPPEPSHHGGDITTDGSTGKIWELKQNQFDFGPGYPVAFYHVCRVVHPSSSWQPWVHVEVEKMVIYEKGATYKAHTDIEERRGVFGTIMISLPSKHEGGVMTFEYCGQKPRRYKSHLKARSFAFWYSGVSHKLSPVTSGYRWVLVLKLIDNRGAQGHRPTGLMFPDEIQTVKRALERWLTTGRESRRQKCLHYLLEDDYLAAKGQYRLLNQDLGRVQLLRAAYSELPIEVFVGSLEGKAVPRGKDIYRIKTLVDLDDHMVAQDLALDEKDILNQGRFLRVKGKDVGLSGHIHIATDANTRSIGFVALVPHDSLASFLKCDGKIRHDTLEPLVAVFARSCLRPGASKCVFDTLMHLWGEPEFKEAISGETLTLCLQAFVQFGEFEHFRAAAMHHQSTLPSSFFKWLRGWLVASPDKLPQRFSDIQQGASLAISSCGHLTDQFRFINQLAPLPSGELADEVETPKPMLDWAREMIHSCLDSIGSDNLDRVAGSRIVDLSPYFNDPLAFLKTALPKFRGMSNPLPFHLWFLGRLRKVYDNKESSPIYRKTARWLIETADFAQLSGETSKAVDKDQHKYRVRSDDVAAFFGIITKLSTGSIDLASLFASKIVADAPRFRAAEFATLWMPFLYAVPDRLIFYKTPLDTPCHQQLCTALVKSFLDNCVGPEPVDTESQTRGSVSCGCVYCTQLNEFLADSSKSTSTLPIARTEREHLKDQIKAVGIDCKCEALPGDSPCTLMTKAPSQKHVENREAWVGRQKTALDQLRKMEKSHLEQLLGSNYSLFLDLERAVDPSAAPQPVARPKRKISDTDIVDLGAGSKKNFKITSFFTKK